MAPLVVIDPEIPSAHRPPRLPAAAPQHRARNVLLTALLLLGAAVGASWWWFERTPTLTPFEARGPVLQSTTPPNEVATPAPAPAGSTTVNVPAPTRPARTPLRAPVTLGPRPAPRRPATRAAADGHLLLNTQPWSEVYLDGIAVGNTPKTDLAVSAGSHRLRFVRDGFRPFETTVFVAAGASVRLTDIVLSSATP